ncbi:hypothetical protein CHS0354_026678 [Potamilus streckersoni]|uniref:Uncharacterized protein n=1 Tax=Potamilus streckersoni TaxID=2493646 RepID=A0AAE0S7Y5_9BIVA|nr:hypothetical protein CHS0354_026678 [Potamilus streckersoni]
MPFQAGEKIRADSGQEVPLQPRKKNIFNPTTGENKLFSFRCAQYYENTIIKSARRWAIVLKCSFKRTRRKGLTLVRKSLYRQERKYLKVGKIVRFQMHTIFRKCPFQAGEKKMGQSTEMSFQAGEKIRADSGQEVPFQPGKKNIFFPTTAGEKIRADSGQEVPLQPRKKNIFNPTTGENKLFSFRCAQYYENTIIKSARRWAIVPKCSFKRTRRKGQTLVRKSLYNQEIRISSSIKQVGTKCSFSDAHNIMKMPLSSVREEDGP